MKAVCYARVSTPGQAEGYSLETQREATERLARALGADEIVHVEDTYTGTALDRPAMNELRELVRQRACDMVVVYDPDRFSRDLTDLLIVTRELDRAGIALHFVNFEWENTPTGRLFLQMRGAIAEFEHALILERTSRGKAKKAAMGKIRTYAKPYGYLFDRATASLVVHEAEAHWVREIYRWFTEEGLSTGAIARRLLELGVPGPRGPNWNRSQVWRILRSHTYTGVLVRKDERPEWAPVRVPRLIEEAVWRAAQARLDAARRRGAGVRGEYLLRGLLVCGRCGKRLVVRTTKRARGRWSYYTCPGRGRAQGVSAPARGCALRPVRVEDLDQLVWAAVASFVAHPANYAQELESLKEAYRSPLRRKLAEARARLQRALEGERRVHRAYFALDVLDEDAYRRYLEEYREAARAARREVAELEAALAGSRGDGLEAALVSLAERLRCYRDHTVPFAERRAVVVELVERVVVADDRIEIQGALEAAQPS